MAFMIARGLRFTTAALMFAWLVGLPTPGTLLLAANQPASTPASPPPASQPAPCLTLATFNISYDSKDPAAIAQAIRQSKADIVCLQETSAASEKFLQRELRREYPIQKYRGHNDRLGAERFGFLSTLPLSKLAWLPPQRGLFGTWIANVIIDGQMVQVVNAHLTPMMPGKARNVADLLRAVRAVESVHKSEIQRIVGRLDPKTPAVIAGDFNSTSFLFAPSWLGDNGFTDSFASVTRSADDHPTWQWPLSGGHASLRVDYIFHSGEFQTLTSRIIATQASDHSLLLSKLGWATESPAKTQPSTRPSTAPASQPAKMTPPA
jgi:endonuclease/exonuclease/phosphatase family metal-dependent hydrolase